MSIPFGEDASEGIPFASRLIVEGILFLVFFLFLFDNVFLGVFDKEELLLGLHLAPNIAAVEGPVPLLLVLFRVELHVNVKAFFVLLHCQHQKHVRLRVVVHVFNLL